jgi:formylglycine-generating enzyme required for sulfatase activity
MKSWPLVAVMMFACVGGAGAGEPTAFFFEMVKMPAGYWVGKYEVTQTQYEELTGENPSAFPGPNRPVENVSWEEAGAFCEKLTAREHATHRLPEDCAYDLPTDAQWDEFSAGTGLKDGVTSLGSPRDSTEPVGAHPPNPRGLCDVVGNVWEWCRDWYDDSIRKKDANPDVPFGALVRKASDPPEETYKVLRGGAWDTGPSAGFSLAARLRYAPGMSNYRTGFRCVVVKRGNMPPSAGH